MTGWMRTSLGRDAMASVASRSGVGAFHGVGLRLAVLLREGESKDAVVLAGEGKGCSSAGRCLLVATSGGIAAWLAGPI